jgi:branched-chain amino acid transport system permease protein
VATVTSAPVTPATPPARNTFLIATAVMAGAPRDRAIRRRVPGVPHEGAVLRALRLRVQPADRLRRPAVVRARDVPGTAGYVCAHAAKEWGWPPEAAILVGTLSATALGMVAGALAIRGQGIYFAMITLALSQMIFFFYLQTPFTHGEDGIQAVPRGKLFGFIDLSNILVMYFTVLVVFLAAFVFIYRVVNSPFGQVLKAIRENEPRAISLGYDAERYKLLAFVLSAALSGLAGSVKAIVFQLASLTDVHWTMSGEVVLMTLLGGMGTIFGPVVGAFAIIGLESYLASFGQWVTVITGAIFVVCVLAFRRGIVGELGAWWAQRKR